MNPTSTRRNFLASTVTTGAVLALSNASHATSDRQPPFRSSSKSLIDTNVSLGHWPLRRLPADEPDRLVAKLRQHHVTKAWVGSFEGLLHKDLASVNARLAQACRNHGRGMLLPFGSVNPLAPDWQEELRRCVEVHRMPGIRLHPNYHGYRLDHPAFAQLVSAAAQRGLLVQLALVMEDERMMHPLLRVEPVDTEPLASIVRNTPGLRLQLINALRTLRAKPLLSLLATGQVFVEISMLEGIGGLDQILRQIPADRIAFGSHAPLFYFEAALLKLQESDLTPAQLTTLRSQTAERHLTLTTNH